MKRCTSAKYRSPLMSPVAPFFADWLYLNLTKPGAGSKIESVHLTLLAKQRASYRQCFRRAYGLAQKITSLTLALRKKVNTCTQPLNKLLIPVLTDEFRQQVEEVKPLILSEVNVKELEFLVDTGFLVKKIKPNFKTIGANENYKKLMKPISAAIGSFSKADIDEIEAAGFKDITVEGQAIKLELAHVDITTDDIPGWVGKQLAGCYGGA
jgi:isoleucyl-tRNA synthetase